MKGSRPPEHHFAVRRLILGADIAILAALGYWIGTMAGGKWAA
jgi:hypothetical protein